MAEEAAVEAEGAKAVEEEEENSSDKNLTTLTWQVGNKISSWKGRSFDCFHIIAATVPSSGL